MDSVDYDPEELIEAYFERGWTDGLPVVPPTEKSIAAMLAGAGLRGDETIGEIVERGVIVSAEKLAINAVMGGCRPEHFPVVLAAMEAMMDPAHNLNGVSQTTHLEALLGERHGAKVERLVKPSGTAPSPSDLVDTAAGAHAAIVGIGL